MSAAAYYHRKMMEYLRARNQLDRYKGLIDRDLSRCENYFNGFSPVYDQVYNLQGEVMDNFYHKSESFSKFVNDLFSKIQNDISIISLKKERANELYLHYKALYEAALAAEH
ncbi:MAG: hypothetical protein ACM3X7_11930 [Solirubrobacterales bacterium]